MVDVDVVDVDVVDVDVVVGPPAVVVVELVVDVVEPVVVEEVVVVVVGYGEVEVLVEEDEVLVVVVLTLCPPSHGTEQLQRSRHGAIRLFPTGAGQTPYGSGLLPPEHPCKMLQPALRCSLIH